MANYQHVANSKPFASEDDIPGELDEPPDDRIRFSHITSFTKSSASKPYPLSPSTTHSRKASLLTRGLLKSPELTPGSDAEAPLLTSDGGLTSPARTNSPSPPLPASRCHVLAAVPSHDLVSSGAKARQEHPVLSSTTDMTDSSAATDVEVGLGRKRCIKFACGRQTTTQPEAPHGTKVPPANDGPFESQKLPKRPCMLKFVCPMKPTSRTSEKHQSSNCIASNNRAEHSSTMSKRSPSPSSVQDRQHRDSLSATGDAPTGVRSEVPEAKCLLRPSTFNRPNLEGSEATRFHEFAGPYNGEDEWVNEPTAYRKKLTVNDTLQKENAIRKLGEEAEEEAKEEEDAEEETLNRLDDLDDRLYSDDGMSDGGNESDDEEGFAESDDESETGSEYQFWTPGLGTAATSTDHLEHFRPIAPQTSSTSSIESMIQVKDAEGVSEPAARRARKSPRTQPLKMRPGTPDLPDSTDFVCGTLDEDRPLEAAYMSCLEERRRSKHPIIPQDIDPSFPTSDPEEDEDDKGDKVDSESMTASDEPQWVTGQPDKSDEEQIVPQRKPFSRRNTKSPMPSPKRMRSPPPQKRAGIRRTPAPFTADLAPSQRNSSSSLSESGDKRQLVLRRPSLSPPKHANAQKMTMHPLPRRPNLTHTASLPRTPNPFWTPCCQSSRLTSVGMSPRGRASDVRTRGPIDIVTGLEKKRQRRKEKFWRQHYRNGGRDRMRCQPGKGAERMRELGLEMAGKNKGQLPHVQLMLSI